VELHSGLQETVAECAERNSGAARAVSGGAQQQ